MTAKDQKNFILGSPLGEGPTAGTNEALGGCGLCDEGRRGNEQAR